MCRLDCRLPKFEMAEATLVKTFLAAQKDLHLAQ